MCSIVTFNKGNRMKKIALLSLLASSLAFAGGYKIPETSLNALALGAANIAHNKSADTAYYNPANMVFMQDVNHAEFDLMYIGLEGTKFEGSVDGAPYNISAKEENFIVPSLHFVSSKLGNARVGLSVVVPAGLTKRWSDAPAIYKAEEFTLQVVEFNPSIAIPITQKLGVAFGFRIVHSEGTVKASRTGVYSQHLEGDSIDYGYNLALAYKPTSQANISMTYRSKVNLTEEGSANLFYDADSVLGPNPALLQGDYAAGVSIPLPAILSLAASYTFETDTTVEFVYERNFWSAYKSLNFEYENPYAEGVFGTSTPKNWKDSNGFRLGITQELEDMTLMAGAVYDRTPVPEKTLSFELPDSDSIAFSLGGRYKIDDTMELGLAALYSMRESELKQSDNNINGIVGKFSNAGVLMVSAGISYKF